MNLSKQSSMNRRYAPGDTRVEIKFPDITSFLKSYMSHLAHGGLFVKTENPLPLDSHVLLKIALPDHRDFIEVEGTVVLTNPYGRETCFPRGMGIKFEKIEQEDMDIISKLAESRAADAEKLFIL